MKYASRIENRLLRSILAAASFAAASGSLMAQGPVSEPDLVRLPYSNPGLVVDLGVGLWAEPLPVDWDGDGDLDLVVACPDKPSNGLYFFENQGGDRKHPVFAAAKKLPVQGRVPHNVRHSRVAGQDRILGAAKEYVDFRSKLMSGSKPIEVEAPSHKNKGIRRADQWQLADIDGDGDHDLVVAVDDWGDYGWDEGYTATGQWLRGPLRGLVFIHRNQGNDDTPKYGPPERLMAGGKPLDVYGWPSPCVADFDGDGDLDLMCGEFTDGFTYFENTGDRTKFELAAGVRPKDPQGRPLRMNLCMIKPTPIDWDGDGDIDLIVGDEDGRVAFVEHNGVIRNGVPVFLPPYYFEQQADTLKSGALATPVGADWDGDGDDDIIAGNTSGNILYFENLGGSPARWNAPVPLTAAGREIRFEAGPNGSIQGPAETKWGYTTLSVADWDMDGRLDLIVNSIWGSVRWFRNVGKPGAPVLEADRPIEIEWKQPSPKPVWTWWNPAGDELVTQWRTTPVVVDWTGDGLPDLVMLDSEGFLALFRREKRGDSLVLLPPVRAFVGADGKPLKLSGGVRGKSGRRKLVATDWDGDGRMDLLINSSNASFLRNMGEKAGIWTLADQGPVAKQPLDAHDTQPALVDIDGDGKKDILIGAEDGRFYVRPEVLKGQRP
jgi:hypothetical protein